MNMKSFLDELDIDKELLDQPEPDANEFEEEKHKEDVNLLMFARLHSSPFSMLKNNSRFLLTNEDIKSFNRMAGKKKANPDELKQIGEVNIVEECDEVNGTVETKIKNPLTKKFKDEEGQEENLKNSNEKI
uniref:Uncharacterized protein n=1 Tax=Euplotes harpa TaxID=151035 RepID=A0A7S3JEB7_9SPIT|mmetsp:Transcript_35120/g.40588  ORF Transcript_35120/g.40588 Transcript_35120/m.40588 type:complete len:131 (+) Transcript_35120:195-587(+)|eukprot:CAMPEP_0168336926 /NCGR_PEP_ID=MMETSP0213-20121227/11849_1 /TAXON_ID=151035 /ORGANISM="Euplotes harpa, Strain FSP1.4" /LENGTH=130 /DNA_ID=CAMNT_0008342245 /DNA_START=192 /DNA_END=584 /DNA_ORIENTATION=-